MQVGNRVKKNKKHVDIRIGTVIEVKEKAGITQINVQWKNRTNWHHMSNLVLAEETLIIPQPRKYSSYTSISNSALPNSSIGITEDEKERYKICALFNRNEKNKTCGFQELILDRQQLIDLQNSIRQLLEPC